MKKFFVIVLTLGMLASSALYSEKQTLSAQDWEKQYFASLDTADKKTAILILRGVKEAFEQFEQAVDKGGEAFLEAFNGVMSAYMQLTQVVVPRLDMYKNKLGLINSIAIVPDLDDIQKIIQGIVPQQAENEREVKRAINKALRNKNTKLEVKNLIASKYKMLAVYVELLEKNYADIIQEFEKTEKLLKKIKEKADNGQDLEQILGNMSAEEQKELMQLLV